MAFNKNKVMDAARRYVEKGQTDRAIKEYLRVVKEDPKDVRVWLKIGDLYAKKGAKVEAVETYLRVAKVYGEQGFYLKAVAVYKQILKIDPRLIEINLKLAELYRQLGLMSDAMRHFEMVAGHFHREGKTQEALATVRQLVELDPENVATRIKLAELYSKEGMVAEAVSEFAQAGDYLRAHNRQDDFIKVAERMLWHKPDNMELNRELAGLYLRRNDPRRALQKLQACFKSNPRDVETLALLAQAFQALEQKSKTVQVLKELARVLQEDGEHDRAKDVYRKIQAFVPADPDAAAYLGHEGTKQPAAQPAPPVSPQRLANKDIPVRRRHNPTGSVPLLMDDKVRPQLYGRPATTATSPSPGDTQNEADFTSEFTAEPEFEGSAAGEIHAEEIAKLLTETDVYIKYGLNPKAIEHLRRVFELDPSNVEAHERLKDILLKQGRENDAIAELMTLAEILAPREPARAEAFLREALAIDGTYQPAFQLAERFRLNLTGEQDYASVEFSSEGGVAPVEEDIDFGDIEFASSEELLVEVDPAQALYQEDFDADAFEFELEDIDDEPAAGHSASKTMEISADEVETLFEVVDDDDGEELDFDGRGGNSQQPGYGYGMLGPEEVLPEPVFDPADAAAFDAELRFDPADAAAFDAEPGYDAAGNPVQTSATSRAGSGYDTYSYESGPSATVEFDPSGFEPAPTVEFDPDSFPLDPGADEYHAHDFAAEPVSDVAEFAVDFEQSSSQRQTQDLGPPLSPYGEQPIGHTEDGGVLPVDTGIDVIDEQVVARAAPELDETMAAIEDELDEADFFVAQGLINEARDLLNNLLATYPGHPLLMAKLQDLDQHAAAGVDSTTATPLGEMDFSDLDDIDLGPLVEAPGGVPQAKPTVLLENPVDDEDADTHYDLGLAYKEMGLYDEAIKAFKKVVTTTGKEVQCRLMLGLCFRERGEHVDAIGHFKAGLHAPGILEREQHSLYYEIALSYEMYGDLKEALYFYGLICKKDPSYRDVRNRMSAIQGNLGDNSGDARAFDGTADDAEAAIDSLLAEGD